MSVKYKYNGTYTDLNGILVKTKNYPVYVKENDVTFYDYDGTIVDSYTKEEFAQLSALPSNPTHQGLTAQGWNYTLADAKTYVATYGKLNIGQNYRTSDGKTRLYITLREGRLKPMLGLGVDGSVDVDWGDGTAHDTLTESDVVYFAYKEHEYAQEGDYVITLTVTGKARIAGGVNENRLITKRGLNQNLGQVYTSALTKVELGDNIEIGRYAFYYCHSLTSIMIPNSVTSIGEYAFKQCNSLTSIILPNGITTIGTYAFELCYSLANIILPNRVVNMGLYAFTNCYGLTSLTIPNRMTTINEYAFYYCHSLKTLIIPEGVTEIGNGAFRSCYSLLSVTIPSGVTSIGASAFSSGQAISFVIIPSETTVIGSQAFDFCKGIGSIEFSATVAPTAYSQAFGVANDCIIYIPYASQTSYLTAANYPDPSVNPYLGYNTFASGAELPTISQDTLYSYTWYETADDAVAQTNPISVGTGNEIYCRFTAIT